MIENEPGSITEFKNVRDMTTDEAISHFQDRFGEIRRLENRIQFEQGQYNEEFKEWLIKEGMPDNFALIDVIAHFRKKLIVGA